MRTSSKWTVLALVAALTCAGAAFAQTPGEPPPDRPGDGPGMGPGPGMHAAPGAMALGPVGRALRDLDLTGAQRDRVRELVESAVEGDLREAAEAHRLARREVEMQVWAREADEVALLAALQRSAETAETLTRARAALARSIRAELTEEQNAQLDEMLRNLPDEPPAPRHRGGRRGGRR